MSSRRPVTGTCRCRRTGPTGLVAPVRRREPSSAPKVERMRIEDVTIAYGEKLAVDRVTLPVRQGEVLALIGPSGCGKTTLLRSLNRLVEITPTATRGGTITLDGEDIDQMEVTALRRRVSMVFQQPNPFPMSVFDNIAYALREQGSRRPGKEALHDHVADALSARGSGTRSAPPSTTRRCASPVVSSSASASLARSPPAPRCCCSTSPARRSTRARPR